MKKLTIISLFLFIVSVNSTVYSQAVNTKSGYKFQEWKHQYEEKCSKCHTLERVFADLKTAKEWRICVARMMRKSPLWITPDESDHIADEIIGTKKATILPFPERDKYKSSELLFIDRCTKCHSLNRILSENKTEKEWKETVERMKDNAPDLFNDNDIQVIVDFLTDRGQLMRDDFAAKIMVNKCLVCHEWGRILLETKSREEWEVCVNDMRKRARKTMKKDWFTHHEFHIIVDLLVKTQGRK